MKIHVKTYKGARAGTWYSHVITNIDGSDVPLTGRGILPGAMVDNGTGKVWMSGSGPSMTAAITSGLNSLGKFLEWLNEQEDWHVPPSEVTFDFDVRVEHLYRPPVDPQWVSV